MIFGEKTYLIPVSRQSLEKLRKWRNTPEIRKYFREHREISAEMQEKWYEERVLSNPNQYDFEIHATHGGVGPGALLGHCGLNYVDWVNRRAEFTIYIGNNTYKGRGCGKDALSTLLKYGFNTLNLNKIQCEVFTNNEGAIGLYRNLGFTEEGIMREHHYDNGEYIDSMIMSMLKSEWEQKDARME